MEIIKLQAEESAGNRVVDLTSPVVTRRSRKYWRTVNALAISPTDQNIIYAGAANEEFLKQFDEE